MNLILERETSPLREDETEVTSSSFPTSTPYTPHPKTSNINDFRLS
ncbi:MAG: hypothetical protein V7K47_11775 [Nostoc sp.]